jgi:hypothetical protein
LVSITSAAEQSFLERAFFKGMNRVRPFWIGLSRTSGQARFVWAGGEPVTFTQWSPEGPGSDASSRFVAMNHLRATDFTGYLSTKPGGTWSDVPVGGTTYSGWGDGPYFGIMETEVNPQR